MRMRCTSGTTLHSTHQLIQCLYILLLAPRPTLLSLENCLQRENVCLHGITPHIPPISREKVCLPAPLHCTVLVQSCPSWCQCLGSVHLLTQTIEFTLALQLLSKLTASGLPILAPEFKHVSMRLVTYVPTACEVAQRVVDVMDELGIGQVGTAVAFLDQE